MAVTDRAPEDEELVDAVSGPKPPISVDFDTLKSVNPDVVGWIYIEALDNINYPVVQGMIMKPIFIPHTKTITILREQFLWTMRTVATSVTATH